MADERGQSGEEARKTRNKKIRGKDGQKDTLSKRTRRCAAIMKLGGESWLI